MPPGRGGHDGRGVGNTAADDDVCPFLQAALDGTHPEIGVCRHDVASPGTFQPVMRLLDEVDFGVLGVQVAERLVLVEELMNTSEQIVALDISHRQVQLLLLNLLKLTRWLGNDQ
jgi:hypothetical protein